MLVYSQQNGSRRGQPGVRQVVSQGSTRPNTGVLGTQDANYAVFASLGSGDSALKVSSKNLQWSRSTMSDIATHFLSKNEKNPPG